MAVYKVIQDIEAEDKLVGFLTLKSFIYAIIASSLAYINVRLLLATQVGPLRYLFITVLAMPMLLFGILALPLGREQPTEVWILSRVRFFLKPRIRTWNQSGILEFVTITAPKKLERQLTKNLTQKEVRSRLKALATTLDSRGWAVRNVSVNLNANPSYLDIVEPESDRLTSGTTLPQNQTAADVHAADDIMDEQNNPTAQHFEALMQEEDARRKKNVSEIISKQIQEEEREPEADYSFLDKVEQPDKKSPTQFVNHSVVAPGSESHNDESLEAKDAALAEAEKDFLEKERKKAEEVHARSAGFKTKSPQEKEEKPERVNPVAQPATAQAPKPVPKPQPKKEEAAVTATAQTAKLEELAQSGSAFSVATVQKLANRDNENIRQIGPNEVEISLHGH